MRDHREERSRADALRPQLEDPTEREQGTKHVRLEDAEATLNRAPTRGGSRKESNWVPTGEDWFILFRLYGPTEGWYESGWKLPDFRRLN